MSIETARLGIMTADTFKNRTKATKAVSGFSSKFKSRGSSMTLIDFCLHSWDYLYTRDKTEKGEATKIRALDALSRACKVYINERTNTSALATMRKGVVTEVLRSCEAALAFVLKRASGAKANTKALQPSYANERNQYVQDNKTDNPYSASAIHGKGDQTTLQGFIAIANQSGGERVEFMKRDERLKHLLVVRDGLLYQDGEPYSCDKKVTAVSKAILAATYAMDKYGNLFSKKVAEASRNGLRFNHSSYCAGKEIICAGTLACLDGHLLKITNSSGHYAPDAGNLRSAVTLLAEEDVDLDVVALEGHGCVANDGISRASTFATTGAPAAADWKYQIVLDPNGGFSDTDTKVDFNGETFDVWEPA